MSKLKLIGLSCMLALSALSRPVLAQYMYLDVNGDSLNTSADVLSSSEPTILTIYLDTYQDRDGSQQSCNSHSASCGAATTSQALDIFGYTISLVAVGGTVQWGTFSAADANFTPLGSDFLNNQSIEINRFRPGGTFTSAGLVVLGTIQVTVESGTPHIEIAHTGTTANPSGFGTGFATECDGAAYPHTYVLGDGGDPCGSGGDWFDVDGVAGPPPPPDLAAPQSITGNAGEFISITASVEADDPSLPVVLHASGYPPGFTFESADSTPTITIGRITGSTAAADTGHYVIQWQATQGTSASALATTALQITDTGLGVITGTSIGGTAMPLYVTSWQDASGWNATVGKFDDVNDEPLGTHEFIADIDVRDGGYLSFSYTMQTLDYVAYDWMEVYLQEDSGVRTWILFPIGNLPGGPGLYVLPVNSLYLDLAPWHNQHLRLVTSVFEDGDLNWLDTQGTIRGLGIRSCPIPPITPLFGEDAIALENNPINLANLTPTMQSKLSCFEGRVQAAGGTPTLSSAWRNDEYQNHLYEVWQKAAELKHYGTDCGGLKQTVNDEMSSHGLSLERPVASSAGHHPLGVAFDMSIPELSDSQINALADECDLLRPLMDCTQEGKRHHRCDRVHFELIRSLWP